MFTSKVDAIHAKKSAGGFPWINGLSRHYLKVLWPQISVCGLVARNADRVAINVGWLQLMWAELQLMWARAPTGHNLSHKTLNYKEKHKKQKLCLSKILLSAVSLDLISWASADPGEIRFSADSP